MDHVLERELHRLLALEPAERAAASRASSFVYVHVSGEICNGRKGHTTTDSTLRVGGVGQFRCRVDTAKITYSRPVPS